MQRMLAVWGKVDMSKLRRPALLNDADWSNLYAADDVISRAPIYIDDTPALTTLELRARARRLKAEKGLGLVIVDYLQLMRTSRRTDSRELEISDISRSLKGLAKEMNVPVVALSQLNRKVEERGDKRPMLSDLRESGAIEQDADVIMFVYRDDVYKFTKPADRPVQGIAEIITVESDLVNVDFADVSKVMRDSGRAHMAVATAEGDNRAETAAEASLRSPLLDHNLISGAKNILLNISVSNADSLMYEEVVRILEYIQAHASVQDDNGVIHNANIIWGTSEKPQLGNAIELVVVATGFSGDASVDVMKQIIPPARITDPVKEPVAPVLEPIKPVAPPQRPPEQVMLGAKSTRYNNIELLLAKPAYQSRNSKFIVQMPGGRKEVLREESENSQQAADSQGGSLFD